MYLKNFFNNITKNNNTNNTTRTLLNKTLLKNNTNSSLLYNSYSKFNFLTNNKNNFTSIKNTNTSIYNTTTNININNINNKFINNTPKFNFSNEKHNDYIKNLRNIGISAHIDSGKTTFTERILFYTGRIAKIHEVKGGDKVGAKMDSMELERERGITIQSAATYCSWNDNHINIIDTPGHVDFTIEVERALRVLDGAVLLVCGSSGVQPQTLTVNRQMSRYQVPALIFINKLDRAGANPWTAIDQIRQRLKINAAAIQIPIGLEDTLEGIIDIIDMKACYFDGDCGDIVRREEIPEKYLKEALEKRTEMIEKLAEVNSTMEEHYLMAEDGIDKIPSDVIKNCIRESCVKKEFSPVCMGSAIKNKGVQLCLSSIIDFLPNPLQKDQKAFNTEDNSSIVLKNELNKPFVGLAFKLEENKYGQLTYIRAYQGKLKRGDTIYNMNKKKRVKITRLVRMHSDEMEEIQEVECGEIFAIFGVDCSSGDTFSIEGNNISLENMHVPEAVMSLAIKPARTEYIPKFLKAIQRFQREDPTFRVGTNEETEEMIMSGMGELHLQVYAERIRREYDIDVVVGNPQVNYRESIAGDADFNYLHKKQSGGSGQFARVIGHVEPLIEDFTNCDDTSNQFVDDTGGDNIPNDYIPAIEKAFHESCRKGPLTGSPVIGMKYVLEDGQTHTVDSSSLAFGLATKYSITQAFESCNPVLLEPIMSVEVSGPAEYNNGIANSINKRKGNIINMTTQNGLYVADAQVALSNMFGYATELRSITQGVGEFSMEYSMHLPVPEFELQKILDARYNEKMEKNDKKAGKDGKDGKKKK